MQKLSCLFMMRSSLLRLFTYHAGILSQMTWFGVLVLRSQKEYLNQKEWCLLVNFHLRRTYLYSDPDNMYVWWMGDEYLSFLFAPAFLEVFWHIFSLFSSFVNNHKKTENMSVHTTPQLRCDADISITFCHKSPQHRCISGYNKIATPQCSIITISVQEGAVRQCIANAL